MKGIAHDGELDVRRPDVLCPIIVDILEPFMVIVQFVRRKSDHFHVTLRKVGRATSDFA